MRTNRMSINNKKGRGF